MADRPWHDLSGKVALVYGASRGLGRAAAIRLGDAGARVACAARSLEDLEETASVIEAGGGEATAHTVDVREESTVEGLGDEVMERFGQLDVVVYCAGVMHAATALRTGRRDWEKVMGVNLEGAFVAARDGAARMKERGGRIILFGTTFVGRFLPMTTAYSVSKAGLHQLVASLAVEWARYGITVNGIAPGYFDTEMPQAVLGNPELREELMARIPASRVGNPEEIGPLVQYLASDASAYMTGSILRIDGGQALNVS